MLLQSHLLALREKTEEVQAVITETIALRDEPEVNEPIGKSSAADGSYFNRCIGEIQYKTLPFLFSTLKWMELVVPIWRKAGEVERADTMKEYYMSKGKERGWLNAEVGGAEAGVDNSVEQQSSGGELLYRRPPTTSKSALSKVW